MLSEQRPEWSEGAGRVSVWEMSPGRESPEVGVTRYVGGAENRPVWLE